MHSTETVAQRGKISRPVSPKTIPPCRRSIDGSGSSSSSANNKEARPKMHTALSTTDIPPPPSTKPNRISPPGRAVSSPSSSAYILALQALDPRPLQDLHNERSYLLHDLQRQGDRATRLFHRYAAVEARLAAAAAGARSSSAADTKRCRREAALVRAKIAESTQQEQLILLRLGEIHVELQNRERWMLVHHHQRLPLFQQPLAFSPPPSSPLSSLSLPWSVQPTVSNGSLAEGCPLIPRREQQQQQQQLGEGDTPVTDRSSSDYFSSSSVLSPLSPCFTPGVVFAEDIWSRAASKTSEAEAEGDGDGETGGEDGVSTPIESVDGTDEMDRVTFGSVGVNGFDCNDNVEGDLEEDAQAWRAKLRRVSLYFPVGPGQGEAHELAVSEGDVVAVAQGESAVDRRIRQKSGVSGLGGGDIVG
ncbi:hypothetical protein NEMBOFW57_007615 [Staphylotrichum longicolle]|uniref:Uncharacterized protein n=1 Tax=Staphylotrichum longicolle TaxID=669026 RepID=A0AAD4HXK8_9PEZI|nr:hypothetical protein NEMBOFW57_007615 [Staphylotrichum longicolle]